MLRPQWVFPYRVCPASEGARRAVVLAVARQAVPEDGFAVELTTGGIVIFRCGIRSDDWRFPSIRHVR